MRVLFRLAVAACITVLSMVSCKSADRANVQDGRNEELYRAVHLSSLPELPAESSLLPEMEASVEGRVGQTVEYKGTEYIGAHDGSVFRLYALSSDGCSSVTSVETGGCRDFCMAFQSSGKDASLYLFTQDDKVSAIYSYNLRTGKWNDAVLPDYVPDLHFKCAVPRGSSHIALLADGCDSLHLYHTITSSFVTYPVPGSDGRNVRQEASGGVIYEVTPGKEEGTVEVDSLEFRKLRSGFTAVDSAVIVLYFLSLVLIGWFFSRRQKSSEDYFKGGHRIPWWAAGLSLFATSLSAITFMSIPAKAYVSDWSYMLFNSGIVLVCPVIMFLFIPYFRKLKISTAYEYLERRFNYATRFICSVAFIVYQVGRMGIVLFLPSIAIHIVTGVDIFLCIALMGVFSILYTRMGGIEAVVWTDALQTVILLGGAVFAVFHIVHSSGLGMADTISTAAACGKFSFGDTRFDLTDASMWTVLIATVFTNLTTYGTDQSMVQRYLTTSSQKAAQKSVLTNAVIAVPATVVFFLIGTVLFVYYRTNPAEMSVTMENTDAVFPWYIYCNLPVGVTGLLISGIFAAAMSTLSGSMNSAATAYVTDIRPKLTGRSAGDKDGGLKVAKRSTFVIGTLSLLFACLMATWDIDSLWDEFNKILGLILGSMGGLFMLGMVTKKANATGALAGMAISVIVQFIVARFTPVYLLLYTTVGFIVCFVVGYVVSLLFPTGKTN